MNKFLYFSCLFFFMLTSCSQVAKNEKKEPETASKTEIKSETKKSSASDVDTIPFKVITTGIFHNDEVWDNISNMKWVGLFKGNDGYYLKQTKISATHINDPILDEDESITTGWEVSTIEKDTAIVLMQDLPYLTTRKIKAIKLSKTEIYPGESVSFRYMGIDYELFATGNKKKENDDSDWSIVSNYKLYLTAKVDGKLCKRLLTSHKFFDDQMVSLIFAGDLDGDGILDLVLDNSNHYNVTAPAVYLSKPASKGQIVRFVGSHISVGC